jgi:hypothetical protein
MGSFAFLRKPEDPAYTIEECHINFWSLGGLFSRRIFFFDVGAMIGVAAPDINISLIHLSLPFSTLGAQSEWKDLGELMVSDRDTTQLVFGRSTRLEDGLITFDAVPAVGPLEAERANAGAKKLPIKLVSISEANLTVEGKNAPYWSLTLSEPISKENTSDVGQRRYFRIRFITRNPERMWTTMNSGSVAIGDFRIGDTREILAKQSRAILDVIESRFVPIQNLRLFLIVPCYLLYRASSRDAYYMRMFEGEIWKKYLDRRVNLFNNEKLMIYQWRNKDGEIIDIKDRRTEAFKASIVLSKQGSGFSWTALISTLFGLAILLIGYSNPALVVETATAIYQPAAEMASYFFLQNYAQHGIILGILLLAWAVLKYLFKYPPKRIYNSAIRLFNVAEDKIYHLASLIGR